MCKGQKVLIIIAFCLLVLLQGFFYVSIQFSVVSFADENDIIQMRFTYNNQIYTYNTSHLDNIQNFHILSQAQKHNRLGTANERATLLKKVLDLGFEPLQAFQYCFKGLEQVVLKMQKDIDCNPIDATMRFNPNQSPYFFFEHEKVGYKLDLYVLAEKIINELNNKSNIDIKLEPIQLLPQTYYNELSGYANLRSSFFTSFNTNNTNRVHNIKLAMSKFNGMKIERGKEYSFNTITGKRSEKNGYKPANVIVDKKYVEDFGGGVCQASTTLYNALLLANMDFREVHSHSLASSYVNMGFDAMVNYGTSDLRWVNNTDTDMYVRTYVEGNRVGVQIFGKPDAQKYTYKRITEIEKQIDPQEDEVIIDSKGEHKNLVTFTDESAYLTYPKKGYKVRAILEKYEGDKLIERKFLRRVTYQSVRGVKVVGSTPRPKMEEQITEQGFVLDEQIINFWENKQFEQFY